MALVFACQKFANMIFMTFGKSAWNAALECLTTTTSKSGGESGVCSEQKNMHSKYRGHGGRLPTASVYRGDFARSSARSDIFNSDKSVEPHGNRLPPALRRSSPAHKFILGFPCNAAKLLWHAYHGKHLIPETDASHWKRLSSRPRGWFPCQTAFPDGIEVGRPH